MELKCRNFFRILKFFSISRFWTEWVTIFIGKKEEDEQNKKAFFSYLQKRQLTITYITAETKFSNRSVKKEAPISVVFGYGNKYTINALYWISYITIGTQTEMYTHTVLSQKLHSWCVFFLYFRCHRSFLFLAIEPTLKHVHKTVCAQCSISQEKNCIMYSEYRRYRQQESPGKIRKNNNAFTCEWEKKEFFSSTKNKRTSKQTHSHILKREIEKRKTTTAITTITNIRSKNT